MRCTWWEGSGRGSHCFQEERRERNLFQLLHHNIWFTSWHGIEQIGKKVRKALEFFFKLQTEFQSKAQYFRVTLVILIHFEFPKIFSLKTLCNLFLSGRYKLHAYHHTYNCNLLSKRRFFKLNSYPF